MTIIVPKILLGKTIATKPVKREMAVMHYGKILLEKFSLRRKDVGQKRIAVQRWRPKMSVLVITIVIMTSISAAVLATYAMRTLAMSPY